MTTIKVQGCGCIALPAEIVEQTSLYPGSTLNVAMAPDGKTVQLNPQITTAPAFDLAKGAACGVGSDNSSTS